MLHRAGEPAYPDWTVRVSILDRSNLSFLQNVQTDAGAHTASGSVGTGVLYRG